MCKGCKMNYNTDSPLLQLSLYTGTVVTHARDSCNVSKIFRMNQSYTQNERYY